jgi:hypothetical protein
MSHKHRARGTRSAALFLVRAFLLQLRHAERTPARLQGFAGAARTLVALGLPGGLRIAYPWVGRSGLWRIERATVTGMSSSQRPGQPVAPMSDQAWHRVLLAKRDIQVTTVARWADDGMPSFRTLGGHRRYRWADVRRWLKRAGAASR